MQYLLIKAILTDENEKMLEDAGIKCIYLELSKANQVTNEMTSLGKIFGEEEQAQKSMWTSAINIIP